MSSLLLAHSISLFIGERTKPSEKILESKYEGDETDPGL